MIKATSNLIKEELGITEAYFPIPALFIKKIIGN